jgi:hypothetical protein
VGGGGLGQNKKAGRHAAWTYLKFISLSERISIVAVFCLLPSAYTYFLKSLSFSDNTIFGKYNSLPLLKLCLSVLEREAEV